MALKDTLKDLENKGEFFQDAINNEDSNIGSKSGENNHFIAPTDQMREDLSKLQELTQVDKDELTYEEREMVDDEIKMVTQSILSNEEKMPVSMLKENADVLKQLSDKGFGAADDAIKEMQENGIIPAEEPDILTKKEKEDNEDKEENLDILIYAKKNKEY